MTTHKTSELEGDPLDAAVALAEGHPLGGGYSTFWHHGGPIIERERIATAPIGPADGRAAGISWCAWVESKNDAELERENGYFERNVDSKAPGRGPTPLIAAMRAFVASKMGDTVELP